MTIIVYDDEFPKAKRYEENIVLRYYKKACSKEKGLSIAIAVKLVKLMLNLITSIK